MTQSSLLIESQFPTHTHVERGNIRQGKEVCPHVFNPIAERERERERDLCYTSITLIMLNYLIILTNTLFA